MPDKTQPDSQHLTRQNYVETEQGVRTVVEELTSGRSLHAERTPVPYPRLLPVAKSPTCKIRSIITMITGVLTTSITRKTSPTRKAEKELKKRLLTLSPRPALRLPHRGSSQQQRLSLQNSSLQKASRARAFAHGRNRLRLNHAPLISQSRNHLLARADDFVCTCFSPPSPWRTQ